jgi:hypothetical protein
MHGFTLPLEQIDRSLALFDLQLDSLETGISAVPLVMPGLEAVTTMELLAGGAFVSRTTVACADSASMEARRARCSGVPTRCSVTWTIARAMPT